MTGRAEVVPDSPGRMSRIWQRISSYHLFWGMLLFATWLYTYRIGALPFVVDEIYHGIAVRAIQEHGVPLLPNGTLYLKGALFSYLGAASSALCGSVEAGTRTVSALCLLITGWLVFRTTALLTQGRMALLAACLWLFHPWTVEFARWGRLYSLSTMLTTAAVALLFEYDVRPRRWTLLAALGCLGLSSAVYPFGLWVGLVFGAYGLLRALQHNQILRGTILRRSALVLVALGAVAGLFWLLSQYLPALRLESWVILFSGSTGSSAPSVARFVGYSPYYLEFFFGHLTLFAVSLVGLLVSTVLAARRATLSRTRVVLLLLTLGSVAFVCYVHLQRGTSRYLFPSFPFVIVGAALFWDELLLRVPAVGKRFVCVLMGLALGVWIAVSGALQIPFRQAGGAYLDPNFGPSPKWLQQVDLRSPAEFVAVRLRPGDVSICSQEVFYYYYAGREADYVFRPKRKTRDMPLAPYMSKTREIASCDELRGVISDNKRTVWLSLVETSSVSTCLDELREEYQPQLVFADSSAGVLRIYRISRRFMPPRKPFSIPQLRR